jgi:hypothetical protein
MKSRPITEVETRDVNVAPYSEDISPQPRPKVTTPSILTDDFIDGDYFGKQEETTTTYDDDDDGYGIDEDLASPVDDGTETKNVNLKYVDGSKNLVMTDQVFVVGSFDRWAEKVMLEPDFDHQGQLFFKTTLQLPLGIYRVKFIVNGQFSHTDALPIATDKSGNVVNWFEVGKMDSDVEAGEVEKHQIIHNMRKSTPSILKNQSGSTLAEHDISQLQSRSGTPLPPNSPLYTQEVPQMFQTFMNSTDELLSIDEEFLHKHPIPELPVYLNNNYLNKHFHTHHTNGSDTANLANTNLMQGLNSHILPHVNLRHLLTSNIKNGVLGVACTTRYSGKFVTQIMYSPSDEL